MNTTILMPPKHRIATERPDGRDTIVSRRLLPWGIASRLTRVATPSANPAGTTELSRPARAFGILTYRPQPARSILVSTTFFKSSKKEIYHAWVNFGMLPAFMRGLHLDRESTRTETPWFVWVGPNRVRWEAQAAEGASGDRLAWRSEEGAPHRNHGSVDFSGGDRGSTCVSVNVEFDGTGAGSLTERAIKCLESRLSSTLELLHTFTGSCVLPPTVASL